VPALRSTVSVFVPPWNVGVAPTTGPLVPCWIVMLCISGDMFEKTIVTLPALALSELFVNLSCPLGSAASVNAPPAGAGADEAEADVDALDAVEDDAGAELALLALVLLLLLELPQAAIPRTSATALSATTGYLDTIDLLSLR
jgi:hypothetical protein